MKVRDANTGEEYEVFDLDVEASTPNPDIEGEFLVEVTNPAGENITMSVAAGTQFIQQEGDLRVLPPIDAPNQFEEVATDG